MSKDDIEKRIIDLIECVYLDNLPERYSHLGYHERLEMLKKELRKLLKRYGNE